MAINLVVKGNRFDAARAASNHAIPFVFVRELEHETVGVTNDEHWPEVMDWFLEVGGPPYHNGALLLYNELE